jgi:hypothetical protein
MIEPPRVGRTIVHVVSLLLVRHEARIQFLGSPYGTSCSDQSLQD